MSRVLGFFASRGVALPPRLLVARLLVGSMLVACCGCAGTQVQPNHDPVASRSCTILVTNDSEAHFDGPKLPGGPDIRYAGTIARVAGEKKRVAQRTKGVLLVSDGDILQGRYMYRTDGDRKRAAREALQLYEAAGYDLAVLGNHEFDAGPEVVAHALGGLSKLRIVVSNLATGEGTALHNPDEKLFATTVVRSCGGLKVGFLGLLTPSTRTISKFGDTKFRDADAPVIPAAKAAVAMLQRQGVDAIVVLAHLGIGDEIELAKQVPGLHAVLGGHSHTLLKHAVRIGDTVVGQAGARFSHLGQLVLNAGKTGPVDAKRTSWLVREIDTDMPTDPVIEARVDELRKAYPTEEVIGQRGEDWALRGPRRHLYGTKVAIAVRRWLSEKGLNVHGTVLNAGGIRTAQTYPKGPVTNLEVRAIHPFRNRIVIAEMSGGTLKHLAEHACTSSHRGQGLRVMLAGLAITCDGSRKAIIYTRKNGVFTGISRPGERAVGLTLDGKPITAEGTYRIATNDYMARGGSGYFAFTLANRRCTDGTEFAASECHSSPTLADIVEDAVRRGRFD